MPRASCGAQQERTQEEATVNTPPKTCRTHRANYLTSARSWCYGMLAAAVIAPALPAGAATPEVIATGLSNPRGLAFAPNGALYVAESGRGGDGNCTPSPPQPAVNRCYGETGSIARIKPEGGFERILTGLPSLAQPSGLAEGGPVDVSFLGTSMFVTMSWGGDPALRGPLGSKSHLFGTILHVTPSGALQVVTDV